jgi:hypothetical protein
MPNCRDEQRIKVKVSYPADTILWQKRSIDSNGCTHSRLHVENRIFENLRVTPDLGLASNGRNGLESRELSEVIKIKIKFSVQSRR